MTQEIRCAKLLRRVMPESVILVTIRSARKLWVMIWNRSVYFWLMMTKPY